MLFGEQWALDVPERPHPACRKGNRHLADDPFARQDALVVLLDARVHLGAQDLSRTHAWSKGRPAPLWCRFFTSTASSLAEGREAFRCILPHGGMSGPGYGLASNPEDQAEAPEMMAR